MASSEQLGADASAAHGRYLLVGGTSLVWVLLGFGMQVRGGVHWRAPTPLALSVVAAATVLAASNVLLVAWRVQRRLWAERPGTRTAMGMATSTIVLLLLFVLGWALMAVSHAASEAAGALLVISGVPLAILLTVFVIYGFIESFVSLRTSSDGLETGASFILLLSCLVFVALAMALFSGVLGRLID